MLGEIRDLDTADIAVKASQTGHLVLSTLHTNSAASTLTRLVNIGIPSFNIASSVSLIIAQRLVRRLCESCKQVRHDLTVQDRIDIGFNHIDAQTVQLYKAVGCTQCSQGYVGRIAIFEVLSISKQIAHMIVAKHHALDILKQAQQEGMQSLYQSGLDKIASAQTTLEEINRMITHE
jgi:type IV pilus assembly protein PilB